MSLGDPCQASLNASLTNKYLLDTRITRGAQLDALMFPMPIRSALWLLVVLLYTPILFPSLNAQTSDQKPTLKKFGSSLKKLKWDRSTQGTVDTEKSNDQNDGEIEDVIRVKTDLVVCDLLVLDEQKR